MEKPLEVELGKKNLIVLSGQNGYGKTTLFDAIELVLTGECKRLETIRKNQREDNIKQLANDSQEDIILGLELIDEMGGKASVKRVFNHDSGYVTNDLFINDELVDSDELSKRICYSENYFRMATYISQSKSLDFLGSKLDERKLLISKLFNVEEVENKVELIKEVHNSVKKKVEETKIILSESKEAIIEKINKLKRDMDGLTDNVPKASQYFPLFGGQYDFDKEEIDVSIAYNTLVEPIKTLADFIEDYDTYKKIELCSKIDKVLNASEQSLLKVYYNQLVEEISNSMGLIDSVVCAVQYNDEINKGIKKVNLQVCRTCGLPDDIIEEVNERVTQLENFKQGLENGTRAIITINEAREALIIHYQIGVHSGITKENVCPLCGAEYEKISDAFLKTENQLTESIAKSKEVKESMERAIDDKFKNVVGPAISKFIENNRRLYDNYCLLKDCIDLDTTEISAILDTLNMREWKSDKDIVKKELFDEAHEALTTSLKGLRPAIGKVISQEKMDMYKSINSLYYDGKGPKHKKNDIESKLNYIATKYNAESQKIMTELVRQKCIAEEKETNFIKEGDALVNQLKKLSKFYSDAQNEYQTSLVSAIRIPVLIFSGKILQNFPLGLGINTRVEDRILEFEALEKPKTDVFNILSTGQLNGLAISIVLAARSVYGSQNDLDFLLIDDPLQTIDEISAISLVDLLINSDITQVIMSTHEDYKAKMFKYKYGQRGLAHSDINMKDTYKRAIT